MAIIYCLRDGLPPHNIARKEDSSVIDVIKCFIAYRKDSFKYLRPLGRGFPVFNAKKGGANPEDPARHVIIKIGPGDPKGKRFPHAGYYLVKRGMTKMR